VRNTIWKIRMLWRAFIGPAIEQWKQECWRRDPDEVYCCVPTIQSPCGCYAATVREVWDESARKPLSVEEGLGTK